MPELPMIDWFDELTLAPDAHPVAMGTRALGDRKWLVSDRHRDTELARKAELLDVRRDEVLHLTEASAGAAAILEDLIGPSPSGSVHPLEAAARSVQEDLCLLRRRDAGWFLDASCVCFPTRWRLREKVGSHIAAVHAPVEGYDPRITSKVDRLFDQLTDRPVWRRNWFLMTDTELFQPDRPLSETVVRRADVLDQLFIRSERQTLRRLDREWLVFTIRIQQESLGALLSDADRIERFRKWVQLVSADFGQRRHLSEPQRRELLAGLG